MVKNRACKSKFFCRIYRKKNFFWNLNSGDFHRNRKEKKNLEFYIRFSCFYKKKATVIRVIYIFNAEMISIKNIDNQEIKFLCNSYQLNSKYAQ